MAEQAPKPFTPTQEKVARPIVRLASAANAWVYRLSGGRVGGKFRGGVPVMLLTTIGRKSGRHRTAPLLYLRNDDDVIVVASQAGMSRHPVWFLNLEANPEVEVEIGSERTKMIARRASDPEKAGLWPKLVAMYPDYGQYQRRTEREIPVVILSPR